MWNCMPVLQTHCHHTHIHQHTLSYVFWLSGIRQKCSLVPPQGHCFACGAWWLSFSILFSLSYCLWTSSFFHHLLILIQRIPSGLHNSIFYFFFTPRCSLPSHPLMSLSILHSSPSKLCLSTKGAPMLSQIGVEMGLSAIDKFHPRGDQYSCRFLLALSPVLSAPSNLTQTLHRKSGVIVKRSKPSCCFSPWNICVWLWHASLWLHAVKRICCWYIHPCLDVWVIGFGKIRSIYCVIQHSVTKYQTKDCIFWLYCRQQQSSTSPVCTTPHSILHI